MSLVLLGARFPPEGAAHPGRVRGGERARADAARRRYAAKTRDARTALPKRRATQTPQERSAVLEQLRGVGEQAAAASCPSGRAPLTRLQLTWHGCLLLSSLYYDVSSLPDITPSYPPWHPLPRITVPAIQINVSAALHTGRRLARVCTLRYRYGDLSTVTYTDASFSSQDARGVTVVVPAAHPPLRKRYSGVPSALSLEAQAITDAILSLATPGNHVIHSDSQDALRLFQQQLLPSDMLHALHNHSTSYVLDWVPGHAGVPGDELAHQLSRAPSQPGDSETPWPVPFHLPTQVRQARLLRRQTLRELVKDKQTLPSPSHLLPRADVCLIREAQTDSLPTPHIQRR